MCKSALADEKFTHGYKNTVKLGDVDVNSVDALFFAGGSGTMWDFPQSRDVQEKVREAHESGKVVGAVCHGPVALTDVKLSNGKYLVEGKKVAGFSDSEEEQLEKMLQIDKYISDVLPFKLETRLRERGGVYSSGPDWQEHVQSDSKIVTGQNPASSRLAALKVLELLDL